MTILTEKELKFNLLELRSILLFLDNANIDKLCFINIYAFYSFLDKINGYKYNTQNIVDNLISYIPICSHKDDDLIRLFSSSLSTYSLDKIQAIKNILYEKSIINFFNILLEANSQKDFLTIFNACNNIRKSL